MRAPPTNDRRAKAAAAKDRALGTREQSMQQTPRGQALRERDALKAMQRDRNKLHLPNRMLSGFLGALEKMSLSSALVRDRDNAWRNAGAPWIWVVGTVLLVEGSRNDVIQPRFVCDQTINVEAGGMGSHIPF